MCNGTSYARKTLACQWVAGVCTSWPSARICVLSLPGQHHRCISIRLLDIIDLAPPGAHLNEPPVGARGGRFERDHWAVHSETLRDRGVQPDEPWLVNLHETLHSATLKKGECPCLTSNSNRILISSHGRYVTAKECALMQGFDLRHPGRT